MNAEKKDRMKKDGAWKAVHEAFNSEVPQHLENQLQNSLNAFRQDMQEHPYVRRLARHGFLLRRNLIFFSRPWARPLLWAGMGLAIVVIVGFFILANKSPTWAQVQERFRSMPFCAVSIYKRNITHSGNPLIEPKLVQVWSGYGDRMRIRSGSKVTFVYQGEIVNTFDLTTRSEAYADGDTYDIVNTVGKSYTNALDSILMPFRSDIVPESISKEWKYGELVDTTSLVISDPAASKDLVVFDHEFFYLKSKSWRTRVWALRKSRLPIRVLIWPRVELNGRLTHSPKWDMIITYSKEQQKDFFDPEAFAAKLKDPAISIDGLLYMFHKYPGSDPLPTN
mgnify:FL=1